MLNLFILVIVQKRQLFGKIINLKPEYDIMIAGCISPHYPLRNKIY